MYVVIVTFDFSSKYFIFLVGICYSVVGTIFFFGFNIVRRNTCRLDFLRYHAKTGKQPCVAFRGQGDVAVRQIASTNDFYRYTLVNFVWPHYSSIS